MGHEPKKSDICFFLQLLCLEKRYAQETNFEDNKSDTIDRKCLTELIW